MILVPCVSKGSVGKLSSVESLDVGNELVTT
jgi:hypothetical protein